MLSTPIALIAVALLGGVQAANQVAGLGRLSSSIQSQPAQWSTSAYIDALTSASISVSQGPNRTRSASLPDGVSKILGTNFGNWLLLEPWMSPTEWLAMGGQFCANGDCSTCRQSEWSLSKFLGQAKTNEVFGNHWRSWLTQKDVDEMKDAGMNTVRVPLGFWIVEDIVNRSLEPYAEGGLDELIRGLTMFKNAGIHVLLDHHALPGVSSSEQMFAGNCTPIVEFYSAPGPDPDYNYKRAVTWSVVMAYLSHAHPAFESVFGIEAVNEPLMDATQTPGLGRFEVAFVLAIRAIEFTAFGIICDNTFPFEILDDSIALPAFEAALPIIAKLARKYNLHDPSLAIPFKRRDGGNGPSESSNNGNGGSIQISLPNQHGQTNGGKGCLSTTFMDKDWQFNNPANPADAAHGPQIYDNHLYFNFGGVAPNATEESYMQTLCNTNRVSTAIGESNTPFVTGEWSLAVAFNTTPAFLRKWGDAQKLAWTSGPASGWMFWNWKVDSDAQTFPVPNTAIQWTYSGALAAGLFTKDPSKVFDPNVCAPFVTNSTTA